MKTPSALLLGLALAFCTVETNAQLLNTFPSWDGTTAILPVGEAGIATVGQVFTVEAGFNRLEAFAFGVASLSRNSGPISFGAFVAAWDSATFRAAGPLLFSTALPALDASLTAFTPLIVPTGGLELNANSQYVAFLSSSLFFDGVPDAAQIAFLGSDLYAGGGAVGFSNGAAFDLLGTVSWSGTSADLAFAALFSASPVPEPSTYGVVGALLLGLLVVRRLKVAKTRA